MPRPIYYTDPKAFIKAYRRERRQKLVSKYAVPVAVLTMIVVCGVIYLLAF